MCVRACVRACVCARAIEQVGVRTTGWRLELCPESLGKGVRFVSFDVS